MKIEDPIPIFTHSGLMCGECPSARPRTKLTDSQWELIRDHLPGRKEDPGRTGYDNRMALEGMLWVVRTGAPWRDLPPRFGNWNTVYYRFRRWEESGVFDRMFSDLYPHLDMGTLMVDGTISQAHQHSAGALKRGATPEASRRLQGLGTSMGGLTTKLIAVLSDAGELVDFSVHPGNAAESPHFLSLIADMEGVSEIIADRAYDTNAIRAELRRMGVSAVIPSRVHRVDHPIPHDEKRYEKRHMIENYFSYIKHFRGIATRYCKLAETYGAFVKIAAWVIATR
ncbi:MAG: IS5 family transposase [Chloroflexi bacterium]|nr:IS5 family transposase [Chloroflexota bacterium]